jgi:hypothetical protein
MNVVMTTPTTPHQALQPRRKPSPDPHTSQQIGKTPLLTLREPADPGKGSHLSFPWESWRVSLSWPAGLVSSSCDGLATAR